MAEFSTHAWQRAIQRHLSEEAVRFIIAYGQRHNKAGARIFYLRTCDIPEWDLGIDKWEKLVGSAVILTKDGQTIITVWRNRRHGLKRIKHKSEYNIPELSSKVH